MKPMKLPLHVVAIVLAALCSITAAAQRSQPLPVTPSTGLHTITANVNNSGGPMGHRISSKVRGYRPCADR